MTDTKKPSMIDFVLGEFHSKEARQNSLLLFVFWRLGCSTSRMSMPFFERLQVAYPQIKVVGISQDNRIETQAFCEEKGIHFMQVSDDELSVTRNYEIRVVPSYFLTDSSGRIIFSGISWSIDNMEKMSKIVARLLDVPYVQIVHPEDEMPQFQPG